MRELELYVHIPFCVKKCAYCDFLSAPASSSLRHAYVQRLTEEICALAKQYRSYEVSTIFFGGGTPTVLEAHQLTGLLHTLQESFFVRADAEITIECNPGTLLLEKARLLRRAGFNRMSLGLQSAKDAELAMLGRIHTWSDFLMSYDGVRKAGFTNINVDLMSALPGQTLESWEKTLRQVAMLRPEHLSVYSLIIEEGTPFYARFAADLRARERGEKPLLLPSEETERQMYAVTEQYLAQRGYERYEISNYAKAGFACRHNCGYWIGTEYLGLGLGASSLIENQRFCNTRDLTEYLEKPFARCEEVTRSRKDAMEEFFFLGLRMMQGVSRNSFEARFGVPVESVYGDVLKELEQQGLLESREGRIMLTAYGIDVSNYVFERFLI